MNDDTIVYLVGDKNSEKRNSWLAMTNDLDLAVEYVKEGRKGATMYREVKVPPPRRRRR